MTIPLMVLASSRCHSVGSASRATFPALGHFSTNPFHHHIGGLAEASTSRPQSCRSILCHCSTSLVVALGGLLLGWLVYRGHLSHRHEGRRPCRSPLQIVDPLAKPLGRIYRVLQNKYYFDELYTKVFVKGTQRLSNWLYRFDDLWVIDPIVDGVGKLRRRISEIGQVFDTRVVDGIVNGIGAVTTAGSAAPCA